jgi:DNA replication protein DnaC
MRDSESNSITIEERCELCRGSGWREVESKKQLQTPDGQPIPPQITVVRCDCVTELARELQRRPSAHGVPDWLTDASFETCGVHGGNRHAIARLRHLVTEPGDVFLHGGVGRGKTRLAAAWINEKARAGISSARFVRVADFFLVQLQAIEDAARKPAANQLFDAVSSARALVFDDIAGGEKNSDYSRSILTEIYNRRRDRGLQTVITSNLTLDGIAEFYRDDRLASRIAEAASILELRGVDMRVKRPSLKVVNERA